ncbi:TolC family protein [Flavobacterium sp.]|uniref:TolC family protein n=1 Tax=Flavobacterium sp. TaxID=239 RepID=UPI00286ABE48|nr:TolC family protein [Flavobacterium sp.]
MKTILTFFLFLGCLSFGQEKVPHELSYNEFLGFVKKYHPLVKNAQIQINEAQASLMKARGAFDPKIEVDFNKKQFKDQAYYSILNSSFKIPTWYGIELKASFDNNEGIYLNPENTLPNQGLTSLGISIPLGQGLFINDRMANLRKAKMQIQLSKSEQQLEAVSVMYEASIAYFNWKKAHDEVQLYKQYKVNALQRFKGIKTLIEQGDKPAIDSIEAKIVLKNRELNLEDAQLKLTKAKLTLGVFLWLENNIPLELGEQTIPETALKSTIQETLKTNDLLQSDFTIAKHPKINALQSKIAILNVDRKWKANQLLPKIDLGYTYLSEPSYFDRYRLEDYKIGVNFSFPILLRKERGDLKLAQYKIQETQSILDFERLQLTNKIKGQQAEIGSLTKQNEYISNLVEDHKTMLQSEDRLFDLGESSLFLINSRENNLVTAQLNQIALENRYYISNSELFKIIANPN